ncbi:hypothetical protein RN001_009630 [Aquatica leii]|uniref:CDT1 Geminin-binding domain-containing protein n=1 Tax=Aquatica leii TaxID=1421715 RepID=A0AAN7SFQ6_9COLE|nr:hypothetical protein RN001_009630 [Aquatica leii]
MAQPSVLNYFNNRKRTALEDSKIDRARKVLRLDASETVTKNEIFASNHIKSDINEKMAVLQAPKIIMPSILKSTKKVCTPKIRKTKLMPKNGPIDQLLSSMGKSPASEAPVTTTEVEAPKDLLINTECSQTEAPTAPKTPTKNFNALDKILNAGKEPTLGEIKHKLSRSSRLAELKASLTRFKQNEKKLETAERKTLSLKNFKAIELEVNLSPTKPQSPQKSYLSPIKNTAVSKNLFNIPSPTKNAVSIPSSPSKLVTSVIKDSLTLPYKYRRLAEVFRAMDTVCQILYNRKETITFKKLKPSIEQMLKVTITAKHLSQIRSIYPNAFDFQQQKLREFGTGTRREQWELVLTPLIKNELTMTSQVLLERRRELFSILIEKVKDYHDEFLSTLDPPMKVVRAEIKRWHPQFDLEKVPDIESLPLPEPPNQEIVTTGNQVLEKARNLFNCNTRMERALERLKEVQPSQSAEPEIREESVLKGIPKALLEKVRQRQAAKALESMTRSVDKEKEAQLYSRLPEIARLTRNLFVSEKKNVIPLELVVEKLFKSSRIFLTKSEIETYLKTIAKEETEWIKLEVARNALFVKLVKNYDISLVLSKLQKLADEKMT